MSDCTPVGPELPVARWVDTRDTLQLMTQVVGKVRLANTPLSNHWWNVVLYASACGLTTGLIPHGDKEFSRTLCSRRAGGLRRSRPTSAWATPSPRRCPQSAAP